uniref:FYN binding protein b n=1 Tax=Seriola lalandi dorsalis TaxID=1841481 RepID=A0A3B4XZN9_SERLL
MILFHSFQENKADVKSIMARFQSSGWSTDETSSTPAGRPKQLLHPTLSSGPAIQTKKPVMESLSGSAISVPPKPTFLKNTVSTKSDTEVHEPNKTKALASRFGNTQDDTNSKPLIGTKQQIPLKPPLSQHLEAKGPVQKPPLNRPSLGSTLSDSKPAFPKPTPAIGSKPSWIKEDSGGGVPSATSSTPKAPPLQQKPSSSIIKLRQQNEEHTGANTDTANKPSPLTNSPFKPASNFKTAQNMFNKEKDKNELSASGGANKAPLTGTNSIPPPKPPPGKKPSLKRPSTASAKPSIVNGDATSGPKRNPLPNSLALGLAPAKPNRPPRVNLENFKRDAEASGKSDMELQLSAEQKQEKKREKDEKEEKKRLEAEKKEQREREKKEQDTRKKFKLVGPLEVIHQGKARVDCKSSKTDLGMKQGDCVDIIRVQGNPEGKWLGRTQDGSIGYVKTTSVEIDFDSLKNRQAQQSYDPEVYDDIDVISSDNRYQECEMIYCYSTYVGCTFVRMGTSKCFPIQKGKSKTDETDPKKQKKFEKEEKDFRKKFKYDGEIQVLYQVNIVHTLTNKKWSGKELAVKAGEKLDVIVKAVDNKLICRNEDGKCEYLFDSTKIINHDGDIYDDIGDDCIYDND